ncbi:type II secretion system protein [Mesotoga sp.]|uniref:type II secretion system protein n=1 Tax=Mesotoga sp. TaxID=2053577 RepID=UPI00345ECD01
MKNRKLGFSLVELLIVLAVIAALIATITPVAMNAIKKAKATQVAQNLKTLASAIENKAYVDGSSSLTETLSISSLARDVKVEDYGAHILRGTGGSYTVSVFYIGADSDFTSVKAVLDSVTKGTINDSSGFYLSDGLSSTNANTIKYVFPFTVY